MVITIELSSNTLTKIITIMPKYVIINKTEVCGCLKNF